MAKAKLSDLQMRLTQQIIDYIIQNNLAEGFHLKQELLCRQLGVSRSPVNSALAHLKQQGIVNAIPNRGIFVNISGDTLKSKRGSTLEDDSQLLYQKMVKDRVSGKLSDTVFEAELMRIYKVGRGTLGQTLRSLASDGLLERAKGYGWEFFPSLDSEEAHDESYRLRLLVEPAGIREPSYHFDEALFGDLKDRYQHILQSGKNTFNATEMAEMNSQFHEAIAQCSNNRFFLQLVRNQDRLRRLTEHSGLANPDRILTSCREHLDILEALTAGDKSSGAKLLKAHILSASKLKYAFRKS